MKQGIDKDMTICNVIHRFIYIRLMKGRVAGGATFHQGVILDYLIKYLSKMIFNVNETGNW